MNNAAHIERRFDKSAATYDHHAEVQIKVAKTLGQLITTQSPERILEIGCGTGALSRLLIEKFPAASITLTDPSANMLARARENLAAHMPSHIPADKASLKLQQLNPESEPIEGSYDLIVASMVIHWFDTPRQSLKKLTRHLTEKGDFFFSTIGPDCFPEWQAALRQNHLPSGLRLPPHLKSIIREEEIKATYPTPLAFLKALQQTGANAPRRGYKPLTPGKMKTLLQHLQPQTNTPITWHIQYGHWQK